MPDLQQTPTAQRLHIGLFGRRNSGKSSLLNGLAGQQAAIVSDTPGTTTDPVYKSMELSGLGAVTLMDTAGYDDVDSLGAQRVEKTRKAAQRADIALLVIAADSTDFSAEQAFLEQFPRLPVLVVLSKTDLCGDVPGKIAAVKAVFSLPVVPVSTVTGEGTAALVAAIARHAPRAEEVTITGNLVQPGDRVVLVMPQDAAAPKGRLILPQVQTLRELLDKGAIATCVQPSELSAALAAMKPPPEVVITDSQVFAAVAPLVPAESKLTSFSILMAGYKGDLPLFVAGARAIAALQPGDRVLIAEACSHTTTDADIARVKIPGLLHKKIHPDIVTQVVSGADFPADLSPYALVIHCGGCMFNRAHVLSRANACTAQGVPVTNYGVAIAYLTGILDQVTIPGMPS